MNNELMNNDNEINDIFDNIKELVINSRNKVYATVNTEMLSLYWNIGKVTHQDIGQMQMYVNYYDREIKSDDENPTVGILLSTLKNKEEIMLNPENPRL